jgi:uncharacterized membrane protein
MRNLRSSFLTGLLTLLPIWLVWVVFKFVFGLLSDVSRPLVGPLTAHLAASNPEMLGWLAATWVQTAIALSATVIFVILVGLMTRRVAGLQFIRWFEALIGRIPLAKSVYGSARQLLDMLQTKPDGAQRVVLIEFPHPGIKSVGFVTRTFSDAASGREIAAVYVPTTPNPTGGYLELVPLDELTPTDWSVDQAMTFILSGGAVSPGKDIPFDKSTA